MRRKPPPHPNNLWIARQHAGLGQKTVARLLGHKSRSVISEYENGRLLPSLETALRLSVVYDRSLSDLYPELYKQILQETEASKSKHRMVTNQSVQAPQTEL